MKEYKYSINGNEYNVSILEIEGQKASVEVNGKVYEVDILSETMPKKVKPSVAPKVAEPAKAEAPAPAPQPATTSATGVAVQAPLPGVILDIKVQVGQQVKAGETVAVLEAMKMENNITADNDGTVTAIKVSKGDSISEGDDILLIG